GKIVAVSGSNYKQRKFSRIRLNKCFGIAYIARLLVTNQSQVTTE
ncbi:MAG: hypothetical protein ACI9UN_005341, partial [Granulosicoccus sp.]